MADWLIAFSDKMKKLTTRSMLTPANTKIFVNLNLGHFWRKTFKCCLSDVFQYIWFSLGTDKLFCLENNEFGCSSLESDCVRTYKWIYLCIKLVCHRGFYGWCLKLASKWNPVSSVTILTCETVTTPPPPLQTKPLGQCCSIKINL